MLDQLLVLIIALLLLVSAIVIIVVSQNAKRNSGSGESQLEVLDPDEFPEEDSTDVSDLWGDTSDEEQQETTGADKTDKTDKTGVSDDTQSSDKPDDSKDPEDDKGILKDDIIWGDVY